MKALLLPALAIVLLPTASFAQGIIQSYGTTLAEACYRAAESRKATRLNQETCDRALSEEALSHRDIAATYVNRGILRMISGNLDRAESDFDRAMLLDPSQPEVWLNKGISQLKRGNSQAALPLIARAIELRTRKPAVAFYMRGIANEDAGNIRAAYADLQRARALDPTWPEPAVELQRYQVRTR